MTVGSPRLWKYDTENGETYLRHAEDGYNFDSNQLAGSSIYAYIDPTNPEGVSYDEITEWEERTIGGKTFQDAKTIYFVNKVHNVNLVLDDQHRIRNTSGAYVAIHKDENGNATFVGQAQQSDYDAWEFYLAEVANVPNGGDWKKNTVNHIDIAIVGGARATVPVPYGRYLYGDGTPVTITDNQRVSLENRDVKIETEDMKRAEVTAFKKLGDNHDVVVRQNDVFYITGYSANKETDKSYDQVRIEGSFLVAQGATLNNNDLMPNGSVDEYKFDNNTWGTYNNEDIGYRDALYKARKDLDNRIYYNVTVTKSVDFELEDKDGNPLYKVDDEGHFVYEQNEEGELVKARATIKVDVTLSASFDYWDPKNDCPPILPNHYDDNREYDNDHHWVHWTVDEWSAGGIWRNNGSGMDFILGGDAQGSRNTYALQITKTIEDESGHTIRLDPNVRLVNEYGIWKNANANSSSVIGLNVEGYERDADYTGYIEIDDTQSTVIGSNGIGILYVYDLTGGMYAIQEKTTPSSLPREIIAADGETWIYKETYIETEYIRRGEGDKYNDEELYPDPLHVSKVYDNPDSQSYNSIPEVLGEYPLINGTNNTNEYLHYYVHNVYKPTKTNLTVTKHWENNDNSNGPEGSYVDVVLKRYKLVADGSITPPEPETATLRISDSYSGLSGDRTYNATYTVTDANGHDVSGSPFQWNGSDIVIEDLPFGNYTVTKTATDQNGYEISSNGQQTRTAHLRVGGTQVIFDATNYTPTGDVVYRSVVVKSNDTLNAPDGGYVWVDTNFQYGSTLTFSIGVPSWHTDNNRTYSYAIIVGNKTVQSGTLPNNNATQSFDFVLSDNATIIIYGDTPYYNQWLNPLPTVTLKTAPAGASTNSMNATPRGRVTRSSGLSSTSGTPAIITATNTGTCPDAPTGYYWQDDTTWYDGNGKLVRLSNDAGWSVTVDELEKQDTFGNTYVYYIDSVTEHGMPSGTTARIDVNSGNTRMLVYGDHEKTNAENPNSELSLTNTLPTTTDISIRKVDKNNTSTTLNGAVFMLYKYSDSECTTAVGNPTTITVDGTANISNLGIGYYKLVETQCPAGYIKTGSDPCFQVVQDATTKEVVVSFTNTSMVEYDSTNQTFTVKNEPGVRLPSTGGTGTTAYTLGGAALALLALALLLRKRGKAL